jgi:hypothetical protein
MSVNFAVALVLLAVAPNLSVRVKPKAHALVKGAAVVTGPTHEEIVQRLRDICSDPEKAEAARARIIRTLENYPSKDTPAFIYMFGGTSTGKTTLQKHVEKEARDAPNFIDVSKDGMIWQWDQEYLDLMGTKGLTRAQRFDIRAATKGCRMAADALTGPMVEQAMAAKMDIYQECTRTDAENSPAPLNELYDVDEGELNATRAKWSGYDIFYSVNIVFDTDDRIVCEAERAEKKGFIVPEATLRSQNPLDYQWTYAKNAVAMVKMGIGRSRKFFVQRKCKVKETPYIVDITPKVVQLAGQSDFNPEDFPWSPDDIHKWMKEIAPLRTDCPWSP